MLLLFSLSGLQECCARMRRYLSGTVRSVLLCDPAIIGVRTEGGGIGMRCILLKEWSCTEALRHMSVYIVCKVIGLPTLEPSKVAGPSGERTTSRSTKNIFHCPNNICHNSVSVAFLTYNVSIERVP